MFAIIAVQSYHTLETGNLNVIFSLIEEVIVV